MIAFFYGQDRYRINKEAQRMVDEYSLRAQQDVTRIGIPLEEGMTVLEQALKHRSLFDGPTVVRARNVLFASPQAGEIAGMLADTHAGELADVLVVVEELGSAKQLQGASKELFSFLRQKQHQVVACESLAGVELERWVIGEARERGVVLTGDVARQIIALVGSESDLLIQEVEKLAHYKGEGVVTKDDVALLVSGSTEVNVFDVVDAIATKNKNRAFELLYQALRLHADPYRLLAPITYQFRNLLMVSDPTLSHMSPSRAAQLFGLHPYVAQKTLAQARQFQPDELRRMYGQLAAIDVESKSGQGDAALLLYRFLLSL